MLKLAVTELAEFIHRRGDLHPRLEGRTRAEEGIRVQRRLQADRPAGYQRERPVTLTVTLAGYPVTISGRIDGCELAPADPDAPAVLEEYKTTRADPGRAHDQHQSVHWAQLGLYAGLLGRMQPVPGGYRLRLRYCHPDTLQTRDYERSQSAAEAEAFLQATLDRYAVWLEAQRAHEQARDRWLAGLAFPFPEYRPNQRAMVRRAYRALRDREHLLLEAPTGSGKTAGLLYPALRALQSAGYRRILFLTSRSTGALAVQQALSRIDPGRAQLRHIGISARDKVCFVPGTPCDPELCEFARGYHDRARDAVRALLACNALDAQSIAETARAHRVCPFELSLDAASWCDLVIGDYNYVFDPVVRLKRFAADPDTALLVDESHQLSPRVRDMLSLSIERAEIRGALAEPLPAGLARRVRGLDRALTTLKRRAALAAEREIERPLPLLRAMQRFADELAIGDIGLQGFPATRELLFTVSRWLRADAWYDPERFVFLAEAEDRTIRVRQVCLDAGPYLAGRFADYGGHVRFSGTVSPLALYQRLHGEPAAPAERAGNPFRAEQLKVVVVDDVPTYWKRRAASLPALVELVATIRRAAPGGYLVAFPSFEYLARFADAYAAAHPEQPLLCQRPGMDDTARADFVAAFRDRAPPSGAADPSDSAAAPDPAPSPGPSDGSLLGAVVLGGVFGESVDFADACLRGVICVGVGLPPPSLSRTALARYFDQAGEDGAAVAYHQPAMVKVLQMAGRLLRGPGDRGLLCLVDARFRDPAYQRFFPAHWRPERARQRQIGTILANFWRESDAFPGSPSDSGSSTAARGNRQAARLRAGQSTLPEGSRE